MQLEGHLSNLWPQSSTYNGSFSSRGDEWLKLHFFLLISFKSYQACESHTEAMLATHLVCLLHARLIPVMNFHLQNFFQACANRLTLISKILRTNLGLKTSLVAGTKIEYLNSDQLNKHFNQFRLLWCLKLPECSNIENVIVRTDFVFQRCKNKENNVS